MPSAIPYLDEVWNPITGCTPISPGCDRCWARAMDKRYHGGAHDPVWHPDRLDRPSHWKGPRRIGVVFTGDLFHGVVLPQWRQAIYQHMALNARHTYLILTKRAHIMRAVVAANHTAAWLRPWYGVTVEDQPHLEERLPQLLGTRVAHRWLSIEPLLEPLDFKGGLAGIGWVVVGCESGPGARPCPVEWIESIVEQCRTAGVPVYVKQIRIGKKVVHDPDQFPPHLRIREYPEGWK